MENKIMVLLDTDILIELFKKKKSVVNVKDFRFISGLKLYKPK